MMAGRINAFYGKRPNLKEFAPEGIIGELQRLNYDTANAASAPTVAALTRLVPVSQITYGTDYPYFGLGQFKDLEKLGLSTAELDSIGSGNAARLIPRLRGYKGPSRIRSSGRPKLDETIAHRTRAFGVTGTRR
jgi:hypothetical protein